MHKITVTLHDTEEEAKIAFAVASKLCEILNFLMLIDQGNLSNEETCLLHSITKYVEDLLEYA